MRRQDKQAETSLAWEILGRAPVVHLATVGDDGGPLLRPLHAIVCDGMVCFHGSPEGEKLQAVGRRAVVMAHEVIAEIPSTFSHAEKACPATTLYRSCSLHGVVEDVVDPDAKARVLQALMSRYQPQGGYRPITATDPMYKAAVRGIGVLGVRPERVEAKLAAGQMKRPEQRQRWVEALWERGDAGDAAAAQAVIDAAPLSMPLTDGPHGTRLVLAGGDRHADGAVSLLIDQYWNQDVEPARLRAAQLGSAAWMLLMDGDEVVATARGVSDRVKTSYVADVAVAAHRRGQGLGRFLMGRLVGHPDLRHTRVDLLTRTAGPFYEALGFTALTSRPWRFAQG